MRIATLLFTCAIAALPVAASAQSWSPQTTFEPLPDVPILATSQPQPEERKIGTQRAQVFPMPISPFARTAASFARPAPVRQPVVPVAAIPMKAAPTATFEIAQAPLAAQKPVPHSRAGVAPPLAAAPTALALTPPAPAASVAANAVAPAPLALATPARQAFILPGNTAIELRLDSSVSSSFNRAGDNVRLMVVRDVLVDGRVVIPRGMPVMGEVIRSGGNGGFGKGGRVEVAAKSLTLNGQIVALDGTMMNKGKGAGFGKMALFGALVGVVGMSQVRGKEAIIGSGQTLTATTRTDVSVSAQVAALAQPN